MLKIMLPILFFVVGTIFASFSNMLMYRLAYKKPIIKDSRSYCPKCSHQISWYDNIPLISYLVLKGKCRHCHEKISKRYFAVELYGGLSFLLVYFLYVCLLPTGSFKPSINLLTITDAIIISFALLFLLVSAYVDSKIREIPYSMTITMLVLALTRFLVITIYTKKFDLNYVLGFAIPLVFFLLLYLVGTIFLKKELMGLGDIILFSILGLMLGGIYLLSIVLFSSLICSITEIIRIKKTNERREIPFIPYIFIGTLITVTVTPYIINGILSVIGGI